MLDECVHDEHADHQLGKLGFRRVFRSNVLRVHGSHGEHDEYCQRGLVEGARERDLHGARSGRVIVPGHSFYVNLDRLKLSGWSESTFAAIRHIAVGAYLSLPASNPPFNVEMSCHTLGGNPMNRPDGVAANFYGTQSQMEANTNLADVEYAFQYYHTTGPVEGEAAILKLERKKVLASRLRGRRCHRWARALNSTL